VGAAAREHGCVCAGRSDWCAGRSDWCAGRSQGYLPRTRQPRPHCMCALPCRLQDSLRTGYERAWRRHFQNVLDAMAVARQALNLTDVREKVSGQSGQGAFGVRFGVGVQPCGAAAASHVRCNWTDMHTAWAPAAACSARAPP
jgi:hypothetical protein